MFCFQECSLLCVISTLAFNIFIALLKELFLLASTNAFISLINIPPIAVVPWAIANSGVAILFLEGDLSLDVTSPL